MGERKETLTLASNIWNLPAVAPQKPRVAVKLFMVFSLRNIIGRTNNLQKAHFGIFILFLRVQEM